MTRERMDLGRVARDVRAALTDPTALTRRLGLKSRRSSGGVTICCPAHPDRNPSCSVTRGEDGTVRVRCFSCGYSADAIGLVATVRSLQARGKDFVLALSEAAELAGMLDTAESLRAGKQPPPRLVKAPARLPPKPLPPIEEIKRLWRECVPVADDAQCSAYLEARGLDPAKCPARAITRNQQLPWWARYRGEMPKALSWFETGHRIILPTVDHQGIWRSVRAMRLTPEDPKRLPPTGFLAAGLVLANREAILMLRGESKPERVIVAEGEPDWLTWASRRDDACLGIVSGAWSQALAQRIPSGVNVVLRVHGDQAGDSYADKIQRSLAGRCRLWRAA